MRSAELVGVAQPVACCGAVGGVRRRGEVAQRRKRALAVVIVGPFGDAAAGVIEAEEQGSLRSSSRIRPLMGEDGPAPSAPALCWRYLYLTGAIIMEVVTIGLDISKHVFHVHAVDTQGQVTSRQRRRRGEIVSFSSLSPCLVGIEACATAHYWAREIQRFGHDVRLIPPAYVKPYVRRGAKNDAADAAAICEAVSRPNMRFVPIKSVENQGFLMLHRAQRPAGPPENHDGLRYSSSLCGVRNHCRTGPAKGGWSCGFVG